MSPIRTCLRPALLRASVISKTPARTLSDTPSRRNGKREAVHPDQHARVHPIGETVSDHAQEDESKRSGVPAGAPLADRSTLELFSLANRTIIITGGGRGLGLTLAQAIIESGGHVAAVDLLPKPTQPEWSRVEQYAQSRGLTLTYNALDVTKQESVHSTLSDLFETAPKDAPVRGLFTSAGIQMLKDAIDYTPDQIRKVIDVNLTGSFLCAQAFAKEYMNRNPTPPRSYAGLTGEGGASIVMTGSMSGHIANFGLHCAAYNASKAGVNQLAKNFAMEWGKQGIRVNSLSPGYTQIRTALTAALLEEKPELEETWLQGSLLGRLSTPDEFRGPVIYLLSEASSFMTGADILVDGGHTAT